MATLGLLQLGHETTPELVQLAGAALFLYALAASAVPHGGARVRRRWSRCRSWRPAARRAIATRAWRSSAALICWRSSLRAGARASPPWVAAAGVLAAALATALRRLGLARRGSARTLPVAGASLRQLRLVHLAGLAAGPVDAVALARPPAASAHLGAAGLRRSSALLACLAMGGSDRALMLALPPLAVLAAFALPTLQRSTAAAIDWFSVFFFSVCALAIWVIYAVDADRRARPSRPPTSRELAPGFAPELLGARAGRRRRWARWPGCGWCAGAPGAIATRCGRAWCCRPAAWRCAGCC